MEARGEGLGEGQEEELSGHEPVNMSSFKDGKHLAQGNMTKP